MADNILIKFKVDGKEITATEKDLQQLRKATKQAEGQAGFLNKKISLASASMAALGAVAAAGAMLKFAADTAAAVREIDNLANVSGISTTEFQKNAVAARSVGIESEKLADIYKDVNDRVGDFVLNQSGPLKDFFDTIGKEVGVTIKDFQDLSGPEAMGLFVKSMEEANATQQEMTFFMESMAGDAARLIPLFQDDAAALKEMGDAATGVLSAETIAKAKDLDDKFKQLGDTVKAQVTLAVVDATTALGRFLGMLDDPPETDATRAYDRVIEQGARRLEAEERLQKAIRKGDEEAIRAAKTNLQYVDWAIEAAWEHKRAVDGVAQAVQDEADAEAEAQRERERAASERRSQQREIDAANEAAAAKAEAAANAAAQQRATELESLLKLGDPMRQYNQQLEAIQSQMEEHKDNPAIIAILEEAYRKVKEQAEATAGAQALVTAEAERLDNLNFEKYLQSMGAAYDFALVHEEQLKNLQKALGLGRITAEEYADEIMRLAGGEDGETPFEGLNEELNSLNAKMLEMKSDAIIGIADGFAEMAVSGKSSFKEMAASMLKDIAKLIIKTMILRAIMSFIPGMGGGGGGGGGASAPSFSGFGGPFANGGIAPSGGMSVVGERGPELIMPASQSRVIPNHAMGMGGGNAVNVGSINVTVQEKENETSEEQAARIGKVIKDEMRTLVVAEIGNQSRKGNILNPAPIKAFR